MPLELSEMNNERNKPLPSEIMFNHHVTASGDSDFAIGSFSIGPNNVGTKLFANCKHAIKSRIPQ